MLQFEGILGFIKNSLWAKQIQVPQEIAEELLSKTKDKRVICTLIDQEHSYHCALMNCGDGGYFIMFNQALMKKFRIKMGDKIRVGLEVDTSKYGMPMPKEMEEVLYLDPEGDKYFHALTSGKQRTLLYILDKIKSSHLRIERAVIMLEHLKKNNGKLDYPQLQEDFREMRL